MKFDRMPSNKKAQELILNSEISQKEKRGDFIILNLDQIEIDDYNFYRSVYNEDEIQSLAETINANGLKDPLCVYPVPGTIKYRIESGEQRYLALKKLGRESVQVHLVSTPQDFSTRFLNLMTTNEDRRNPSREKQLIQLNEAFNAIDKAIENGEFPKEKRDSLREQVKKKMRIADSSGEMLTKIISKLIPELTEMYCSNLLSLQQSAKFSSLPENAQKHIWSVLQLPGDKDINSHYAEIIYNTVKKLISQRNRKISRIEENINYNKAEKRILEENLAVTYDNCDRERIISKIQIVDEKINKYLCDVDKIMFEFDKLIEQACEEKINEPSGELPDSHNEESQKKAILSNKYLSLEKKTRLFATEVDKMEKVFPKLSAEEKILHTQSLTALREKIDQVLKMSLK